MRCELAAELLADIRHLDARRREARTKLAAAVKASGTSLTEVFGVGPVIAATVIGDVVIVAGSEADCQGSVSAIDRVTSFTVSVSARYRSDFVPVIAGARVCNGLRSKACRGKGAAVMGGWHAY
ncbi:MAG TPA: hypothetical protein VIG49_08920 [Acetobacteraceae bacterium]